MVAAMATGTSDNDGELRPGDVVDAYRVVSLIAAGGMGDVYEAVHQPTGRKVALKCLKLRHRDKEDARARMKLEAVVLAELRHANLVEVYDAGVTEAGAIWIAMERLHGKTLRELLQMSGALSIPDALYYAGEVADGVGAVHDANVIHRDLKPENVFITERQLVKVLDLGTGKFSGYGLKSTDGARVIGTTAYMAPEQIKGMRVDARADIYALGLVVYEMISGRHPLAGVSGLPRAIEQVALLQLQTMPKPLAEVVRGCPPYLAAIVHRAIAKDRDPRHATMHALSAELRAARKRYIAENRLDESSVDLRAAGEALRQKLGAPPRRTPLPPSPPATPTPAAMSSVDVPFDLAKTELQDPPEFMSIRSTPNPVASSREPTLELPMSVVSFAPQTARSSAASMPTRTNPLGVARIPDLTPEPLSVPDRRRASSRFRSRRFAITLGLGALIGVPPAIFGVYLWSSHRQTASAEPAPPAIEVTQQPVPPAVPVAPLQATATTTTTATATPTATPTATGAPTVLHPNEAPPAQARPPLPRRPAPSHPPAAPSSPAVVVTPSIPARALPSSGL
jgi:eukaryotic-like serine/threonine-protein kinase